MALTSFDLLLLGWPGAVAQCRNVNLPIADDADFQSRIVWSEDYAGERPTLAQVEARREEIEYEQSRVKLVMARQLRLALLQIGILDIVDGAMQSAERATRIEWEYATQFERDHPMVEQMGQALGKTAREIDDLFALAATF